ncbi:Sec-independent protein translocase protein TatB [Pseudonocardia asaccharolytica]|uniref:Sec-independent protein translocase protein TatB n=1 Tax=Pseudonocardia asaccharolytica DSM 44247 = NBRC 16224 TaxID=1123024 RepID=A0A511D1C0_9PSEU|nr:Sec-independent protein translocase protein TatB [Pseudonocardia asaccharolytica]GEL18589.1 sec-independent protein translocase protein TatB [Pseudonocardia asaccharolytica DSM 44247 = NBRC 16224]
MFDSIGWAEILVLLVVGLFVLGPERLPGAAAWLGRAIRQVREYATGARDQLRNELGPEFDELRRPLEDLRGLRDFNPRTAVRRTLFEDGPAPGQNGSTTGGAAGNGAGIGSQATGPAAPRLAPGERPPIDPDAT